MSLNSITLRKLWSVVEETQAPVILKLNDADLIQQLLCQLQNKYALSPEEMQTIYRYLSDRLILIRDMAYCTNVSDQVA